MKLKHDQTKILLQTQSKKEALHQSLSTKLPWLVRAPAALSEPLLSHEQSLTSSIFILQCQVKSHD